MGREKGKMTWQGPGLQMPPWEGHQQLPSPGRGSPTLEPRFGQLWMLNSVPQGQLSWPLIRKYPLSPAEN